VQNCVMFPMDNTVSLEGSAMLTRREQQVAALACEGLSNKLIARTLNVTEGTIKAHIHAIFGKLGVQSRFALIDVLLDRRISG